jgi:hypothetical protein
VLTGAHQVFVPLPEDLNLIQNEALHTTHESESGLYDAPDIAGWHPVPSGNPIGVESFPGRGNVLNLDSSAGLDQVYQDIPTEQGDRYLISFDSRPSTQVYQENQPVASTQFEIFWNGTRIATIQPRYHWKTNTLEVQGGNGDFSRLTFSETLAGSGDRVGAFINHVRVVKAMEVAVTNGGFEELANSNQPVTGYTFSNIHVPGWSATAPSLKNTTTLNLEPTRPHFKGEQGERVLNLNAHQDYKGFRDSISQTIETVPGALYYVRFLAQGNGVDELRVRWDNAWALCVRPDANWESIGLLVQASSLKSNLMFIEGADSNGDIRLDNVEIYRIDSPEFGARPTQHNPTASLSTYASYLDDTLAKKRKL